MASLAATSIEADSLKNESGSDEACTKIWTVYTAEAEKHDKTLMESWTRDMKGVLLFAALFSATLTAFIVESYQTLRPDPTDKIVALLETISRQMSDGNTSSVLIDETQNVSFAPTTSHAPTSSIVCNILWFISLFLSLTCALLATLVEQWTRGFAQKADRNQSPVVRAKIFSYLYSGLKAFGMHTLVDLIPLLLHTSLMMFFAGLVAFLIPIHPVLVGVAATWTAFIAIAYGLLTALPLFHPDSPYWTPLSGILWRVLQTMKTLSARTFHDSFGHPSMRSDSAVGSMIGHMVKQATKASGDSKYRDVHALCWTTKTLTDGHALEVLIEGLSDAIWGSRGRRYSHDHLISGLLDCRDTRLIPRMQQFLLESTSDLLHPSVATRRQIACLKAIWAMAAMSDTDIIISDSICSFDAQLLVSSSPLARNPGICDYLPSVRAILLWNIFRSFSTQTNTIRTILKGGDGMVSAGDMLRQEMRSIAEKVHQLSAYVYAHRGKDLRILAKIGFHAAWSQDVLAILDESQESWNEIPHHIVLRFLAEAAGAPAPYEFEATCNIISGLPGGRETGRSTAVKESAEALITELINSNIEMLRHTPSVHHIDVALGHLLSISHREAHRSTTFIEVVVTYLTQRNYRSALLCVLNRYNVNLLWPRIASRMSKCAPNFEDAHVKAIWELVSIGLGCTDHQTPYDVNFEFWVLGAINENAPAYASTMVLVKLNILSGLYRRHFENTLVANELLRHPLISATGILKEERLGLNDNYMDDLELFRSACIEAHVIAVTDFLLACSSPIVPYRVAETLSYIAFPDFRPAENLHRGAQIHLAKSVQRVIRSQLATSSQMSSEQPQLLEPIVSMLNRNIHNVLTDLGAKCTITDAILEAEEAEYPPVGTFK